MLIAFGCTNCRIRADRASVKIARNTVSVPIATLRNNANADSFPRGYSFGVFISAGHSVIKPSPRIGGCFRFRVGFARRQRAPQREIAARNEFRRVKRLCSNCVYSNKLRGALINWHWIVRHVAIIRSRTVPTGFTGRMIMHRDKRSRRARSSFKSAEKSRQLIRRRRKSLTKTIT